MTLLQDFRYGLRQWLARPSFAAVAVAALAIAIGANVTIYSVARALVLSPVRGIEAPERLVEIGAVEDGGFDTMSYPTLRDLGEQSRSLEHVFGFSIVPLNVRSSGDTRRATGFLVSENYFEALGIRAAQGRLFTQADAAGMRAAPAVVASAAAFQRWFAGDAARVGQGVSINGKAYTLLGVAAPEFRGHVAIVQPDFYVPATLQPLVKPANASLLESRRSDWMLVAGRLAPGATLESARTELATISKRLVAAHPDAYGERFTLDAGPLGALPSEIGTAAAAFSAVMGLLVALVMLVACVNVAGMLIARGESRGGEIAMRYALGASRGRVVAQSLAENAILAFAGGALGVAIAWAATRAIPHLSLPTPFPIALDVPIDGAVLGFALALCVLTALLFGLLPALRVSRAAPGASGSRTLGLTRAGTRLRSTLVVGQVALSLLLLVAAGLFLRALLESRSIDPGFDVDGIVAADLDLEPTGYERERAVALAGTVLERARALPGVRSAALVRVLPLTLSSMSLGGVDMGPGADQDLYPDTNVVSPGYFETLGITLRGRGFAESDAAGAADAAVINARLAERLFGEADPVGRTFRYGEQDSPRVLTVVGVTANGKYNSLWEEPKLAMWVPVAQWPSAETHLVLATDRPPADVAAQLRAMLATVDRDLPAPQAHAMRDVMALSLLPQRIASVVAGTLGAIAALLAGIGLYGLVAYQVAARQREIGVRLALGASPRRIGREVAGGAAKLIAIGLGVGLVLSLGLARIVATQLYGASASDALAFAGGGFVLALAALVACFVPVRRATRVAPLDALRDD